MFVNNLNPILVTIFGLEIRWYGLIYALGIIIALLFTLDRARKNEIKNLDTDRTYSLFIWIILADIIGARLFNVLFYDFHFYAANPIEISNLRN